MAVPRLLVSGVILATVVPGTVLATGGAADPQPGFGVLIAIVALLIALLLARRKRRQVEDRTDEGGSEGQSSVPF